MSFWDTAAGGGAAGGLADGLGSLFTMGAQKRAATKAYQRQVKFWHMQNEYNTPKAQMERLKAGGLNPALMYGQGNTGNSAGSPTVQKANIQGPQLAQSVAAGAQMSLINTQRQAIRDNAEAAKTTAAANFMKGLTDKKRYQLEKNITPYTIQELISRRDQQKTQAGLNISATELNEARSKVQLKTLGLYDAQIQQLKSQAKLNNDQSKLVFAKINEIGQRLSQDWINTHSTARQASAAQRQALAKEAYNEIIVQLKEMDIDVSKRGQNMQLIGTIANGLFGLVGNVVPNVTKVLK